MLPWDIPDELEPLRREGLYTPPEAYLPENTVIRDENGYYLTYNYPGHEECETLSEDSDIVELCIEGALPWDIPDEPEPRRRRGIITPPQAFLPDNMIVRCETGYFQWYTTPTTRGIYKRRES